VQPHCLAASAVFLFIYIYERKKNKKNPKEHAHKKKNPQAHAQNTREPAGARAAFTHRHTQINKTVITVNKD